MTKFKCRFVRLATMQVSRDARNAGRSSSLAEENLQKRMHQWRFQAPTSSKRWKQQPQRYQPKAEDDDHLVETMTVAEPEGEMGDQQPSDGEPEPDEEMADISEPVEGVADETLEDRRPILVPGRADYINPDLQIAQAAMQPPHYYDKERGRCIDSSKNAFAYMAYFICRTIYKTWPTTTSWMSMPYELMQEKFRSGARYDVLVLGNWPLDICIVDQETHISREVTDEEL